MEEIIKLAIEKGGYLSLTPFFYKWYAKDPETIRPYIKDCLRHPNATALDPLFWQALSKALGWNSEFETMVSYDNKPIVLWQYHALRYFELKLTGGSEEAFWKSLLTK